MDDVLLASGIVTFQVGNTIYENNLKARPYTSKGKFVEFKRDTNGEPIFIFKSGDSLIEYKYRVMNDGSLDLYQISNPGNPEPQITNYGMELDNLIQIAHNCEIGSHTAMAAQVAVAGTTKMGEWCICGGQAGISGHSTIGDRTTIGPQCGTIGNRKGGERLLGSPAMDAKEYIRATAYLKRLPDMEKKIKELTKELEALKNN
jgi:hypothetical protein